MLSNKKPSSPPSSSSSASAAAPATTAAAAAPMSTTTISVTTTTAITNAPNNNGGVSNGGGGTPILAVSCRMLRSPSHESFTTDNSLFSISTLALDVGGGGGSLLGNAKHTRGISFRELRGSSPYPEFAIDPMTKRPFDIIPEGVWFEESNDLIRSCAALSATLGIQKSFSTSDITQLPGPPDLQQSSHGGGGGGGGGGSSHLHQLHHQHHHHATSELALNSLQRCGYMLDNPRLDHASRSCSTWVAVGELASASQLPSPHGGPAVPLAAGGGTSSSTGLLATGTPPPPLPAPAFTAADLIRSVNKKVRQNYIRRRLLTTYRALERLSQSEFNLDRLEAEAAAATAAEMLLGPGPTELLVPSASSTTQQPPQPAQPEQPQTTTTAAVVVGVGGQQQPLLTASTPSTTVAAGEEQFASVSTVAAATTTTTTTTTNTTTLDALQVKAARMSLEAASMKQKMLNTTEKNSLLTIDEIEKERGKPLSKYDRNMMIFNWLHSLDEVADEVAEEPPTTQPQ